MKTGNSVVHDIEASLELVRYEIARLKRRLETIAFTGGYEEVRAIAEKLIIIEVQAYDQGLYEYVRDELYEVKRLIARISAAYRIALTGQRARKPRRQPRWPTL